MTTFARKELLAALDTVSPALSSRDLVPQLSCFWFTGKTVLAYDGEVAISVPCRTKDFSGAVPGRPLLGLLECSHAKEVELTDGGGFLSGKMGRKRFKLPLRPPEDFIFKMPSMADGVPELQDSAAFFKALEGCMRSIGSNSYDPDQQGVTVVPNGKGVELFTTNATTLTKAIIKGGLKCARRVILPEMFCKRALNLRGKTEQVIFSVAEDHALMFFAREERLPNVTLFGRLLATEKPYDFAGVIDEHLPAKARKQVADMPDGIKLALIGATVIVGKEASQFTTDKGKIRINSKSELGELSDSVAFSAEQDGVSAWFNPDMLLVGIDDFEQLLITDKCCVMTNPDGGLYLVAPRRPPAQ